MTLAEWAELPEEEPGELVAGWLEEEEVPDYVHELLGDHENVIASRIPDREHTLNSIKEFLGTGR